MLNAPVNHLLPVYVEAEIGASPLFSAGLRSTFLLLGGCFAVPAGYLCDRVGVRTTYLLGATGTIAAGAVFLTHQAAWLFLLAVYIGIASGFSTTASQAYLIRTVPRTSMGLGAAAFFLGMTLGAAMGSRWTGQAAEAFGFQTIGLAIAGGGAVVLLGMFLFMPEPAKPAGDVAEVQDRRPDPIRRPAVLLLLGIRFLPTCYWGTATLLIPLLIYRASGGSLVLAANYSAVSLLVAALCQIAAGRIADTYGPRTVTLTASACVAVSAACTGIWAEAIEGLFLFGTTGAAAAWAVSTMMPRLIDTVAGAAEKGRVVGLAHLAWSLGMLSGSLWGGRAVEWGPGIPFFAVAAGCVATVALLAVLFRRIEQ
jgi:predicted MFS family arabinose efflux permease